MRPIGEGRQVGRLGWEGSGCRVSMESRKARKLKMVRPRLGESQ